MPEPPVVSSQCRRASSGVLGIRYVLSHAYQSRGGESTERLHLWLSSRSRTAVPAIFHRYLHAEGQGQVDCSISFSGTTTARSSSYPLQYKYFLEIHISRICPTELMQWAMSWPCVTREIHKAIFQTSFTSWEIVLSSTATVGSEPTQSACVLAT